MDFTRMVAREYFARHKVFGAIEFGTKVDQRTDFGTGFSFFDFEEKVVFYEDAAGRRKLADIVGGNDRMALFEGELKAADYSVECRSEGVFFKKLCFKVVWAGGETHEVAVGSGCLSRVQLGDKGSFELELVGRGEVVFHAAPGCEEVFILVASLMLHFMMGYMKVGAG
ncbi:MAG: hypothetical protein QM755_02300 [Luteolibacter sp.]